MVSASQEIVSSQRDAGGKGFARLCEDTDYLGGFGLVHDDAANSKIVLWDSAS